MLTQTKISVQVLYFNISLFSGEKKKINDGGKVEQQGTDLAVLQASDVCDKNLLTRVLI